MQREKCGFVFDFFLLVFFVFVSNEWDTDKQNGKHMKQTDKMLRESTTFTVDFFFNLLVFGKQRNHASNYFPDMVNAFRRCIVLFPFSNKMIVHRIGFDGQSFSSGTHRMDWNEMKSTLACAAPHSVPFHSLNVVATAKSKKKNYSKSLRIATSK